jgi:hypothetical protein
VAVTLLLRKMLKMAGMGSSLFLYCRSAFLPFPDELVGNLSNDCCSGPVTGEHYSLRVAWESVNQQNLLEKQVLTLLF